MKIRPLSKLALLRKIAYLILFALTFYSLSLFCHKQTGGFSPHKIQSHLSHNPYWDTPSQDLPILKQSFHYLGKGGQCYAFVSEDGTTVLKLFKMHNLRQYPLAYRLLLPFTVDSWRLKTLAHQQEKLRRTFTSCQIAYSKLQHETALLHLQLNPDATLPTITLIDKLGISHQLSLKNVPFALQKKGEKASVHLKALLREGKQSQAEELLDKVKNCISLRKAKGIGDYDPSFRKNIGLIDGEPFFIDIGNFTQDSKAIANEKPALDALASDL